MVPQLIASVLWITLIIIDIVLARNLFLNYRKDLDIQKLMYSAGLLLCIPIYIVAMSGIIDTVLASNILVLSPVGILVAYLYALLSERFNLSYDKYKFPYISCFLIITVVAVELFFAPLPIDALPVVLSGAIFASILAIIQFLKKFDTSAILLFLAVPCFTICILGIQSDLIELALFCGFSAKALLILAFEVAKRQGDSTSTILVLKKQVGSLEKNFAKLFDMLPDPAIIVDGRGTFLAITPTVPKLTGYKREELIGSNFMTSDLISAHSKRILVKNLAKRMLGFHLNPYEIEIKSKDGKKMQFELNGVKINFEGTPADMVIFRDLTERRKLIEAIEKEQERFQSIAESSGDWIWEINNKGKYTYSNPVVEKILGYTAKEVIGMDYCGLISQSSKQLTLVKDAFKKSKKINYTKKCFRKDGTAAILESHGNPIYGGDGELLGFRGVDRDVTEKKRMEEKLLISERFAAVGQLATMVAHDLRNPLQAIAGSVHFVKKATKGIDNEKMTSVINCIESSVKYSDKILKDLFDYSMEIRLELSEVDPKSVVRDALARIVIPDGIDVVEKVSCEPRICVDIDKLRRVVVNIVSNAFDAMPKGGKLTITSKKVDKSLELIFKDTGDGIPEEKMGKLWTPFVTTKAKGMGLGLPICKRLIDAHGGQILVETQKGIGTCFIIMIPLDLCNTTEFECLVETSEMVIFKE